MINDNDSNDQLKVVSSTVSSTAKLSWIEPTVKRLGTASIFYLENYNSVGAQCAVQRFNISVKPLNFGVQRYHKTTTSLGTNFFWTCFYFALI